MIKGKIRKEKLVVHATSDLSVLSTIHTLSTYPHTERRKGRLKSLEMAIQHSILLSVEIGCQVQDPHPPPQWGNSTPSTAHVRAR